MYMSVCMYVYIYYYIIYMHIYIMVCIYLCIYILYYRQVTALPKTLLRLYKVKALSRLYKGFMKASAAYHSTS